MKKRCKESGGISSVTITDPGEGDFIRRYTYEVPESERVTHSLAVPVTITLERPTKFYWEYFGYATEAEMMKTAHVQYKTADGDYCATCGTSLAGCSLVTK